MQWWAWIAVGAILLGSELSFVNAQFYLVFVGTAALLVGFAALAGVQLADWLQWAAFILLSILLLAGFRARIYARVRPRLPAMKYGPEGETVVLPTTLQPGESCRLEFRGSSWSAQNGCESVMAAGTRARIERIDGLTLVVRQEVEGGSRRMG